MIAGYEPPEKPKLYIDAVYDRLIAGYEPPQLLRLNDDESIKIFPCDQKSGDRKSDVYNLTSKVHRQITWHKNGHLKTRVSKQIHPLFLFRDDAAGILLISSSVPFFNRPKTSTATGKFLVLRPAFLLYFLLQIFIFTSFLF